MADPTFSGVADAFSAFAGGGRLERDAYNTELKRMIDAKSAEAQMTERVQQAFMSSRQNKAQEDFMANPADLRDPNNINAMVQSLMAASGGFKFNDTLGALNGSAEYDRRNRLETADQTGGMTEANAIAHALQGSPELVRNVDVKGGIGLTGQYGDNAELASDDIMKALTTEAAAAGKPGVRDKKIADAMNVLGLSHADAIKYVDRYIEVKPNPVTGRLEVSDAIDLKGQKIAFTGEGAGATFPPAPPGTSLAENQEFATGPASAINSFLATAKSMIGMDVTEREKLTVQARQQFNAAINQLVKAFVENPRMPVAEQEWVRAEIKLLPAFFDDPVVALERMKALKGNIERRLQRYEVILGDPNTPADIYNSYYEAKINLGMFVSEMGNPSDPGGITPEVRAKANSELLALPGWSDLTPDEQEELIGRYATDRSGGR